MLRGSFGKLNEVRAVHCYGYSVPKFLERTPHTHIYLHICICSYIQTSIHLSIYPSMYLSIYLATYLPTYLPIDLSTYLSVCVYTYIYVYIYIYTHKHTYTHKYVCQCVRVCVCVCSLGRARILRAVRMVCISPGRAQSPEWTRATCHRKTIRGAIFKNGLVNPKTHKRVSMTTFEPSNSLSPLQT